MGIVAQCPNGHRVKVKDRFAGKKVVCPHCHASFRVADDASASATLPVARIVPLDPAIVATLPRAFALDAMPESSHQSPQATAVPHASSTTVPAMMLAPPLPEPAAPTWHPRIAEQPAATWSLAWPGGEASPPMTADAMQRWLDSRQATGAELVWRSDWIDWRPLGDVFPDSLPAVPP